MTAFIGRTWETQAIKTQLTADRPAMIAVYGRRRVGKSRLLREATANHPRVLFQATRVSSGLNLESFKAQISASIGASPLLDAIGTWEGVFHYLARHAETHARGLVVAIDEFPYVVDGDRALPSVLQRFWDSGAAKAGNLKLILCGSAVSQMKDLLGGRAPLYGRQTMRLDVSPLPLRDAAQFFPRYGAEDRIKSFAVFGGIPHYLQACDPEASLKTNIVRLLLTETGVLVDELDVLMHELRDPKFYSSILAAMAGGCDTTKAIAARLRTDTRVLHPYLAKLERLALVLGSRSLDADDRSRNNHFAIEDPFVVFWHEFVRTNLAAIGAGFGGTVFDDVVAPRMPEFMGRAFSSICLAHAASHVEEHLAVPAQEIGQIWGRHATIDFAGRLLDQTSFYGACEWGSAPIDNLAVHALKEQSAKTTYGAGKYEKKFLFFSRLGFSDEVLEMAKTDKSIYLVGLNALVESSVPVRTNTNDARRGPKRTPLERRR